MVRRQTLKNTLLTIAVILLMAFAMAVIPKTICAEDNCTVTFDTNGGNLIKPQTVRAGAYAKEPTIVYRDGHDFIGWYKEEECKNAWVFDEDHVTTNTTIYAGWKDEWDVVSIEFNPASDTVLMSKIYRSDNDGPDLLNLEYRGSSSCFFISGDSCTVHYNNGSSKEFQFDKKVGIAKGNFKSGDGDKIAIEILDSELFKEITNTGEGSADTLAASIGNNNLTAEYYDETTGRCVRDDFSLTVTEDREHDCADCIRTRNASEPGCDYAGLSQSVDRCQVCNKYYKNVDTREEVNKESVVLQPLGHLWDEGTIKEEPSVDGEGIKVFRCKREGCNQSYTVSVGLVGHAYSDEWTTNEYRHWHACTEENCGNRDSFGWHKWVRSEKQPTCTKQGEICYICSICGVKQQGMSWETPATNHIWGSYKVDKKATYAAAGSKSIHCSVCNAVKPGSKKTIAKLVVKATAISKLTAGKKSFTVKWKKASGVSGYQIQYALNKNLSKGRKTVKVAKGTTVSKTIKKLKGKKTYYVRVRSYKTVSGKTYYSKWSGIKTVKTKR